MDKIYPPEIADQDLDCLASGCVREPLPEVLYLRKIHKVPFQRRTAFLPLRREDVPKLLHAMKEKWGEGILTLPEASNREEKQE